MKTKQIISLLLSIVLALGMLSGCGNSQPKTTDPTQDTTPSQTQETENVVKFDSTLEAIRVVVDGIVHNFDVQVADGAWYLSARDAETAFGGTFTEEYVALDAYAQFADIRYEQDEVLTAAYFSTYQGYDGADKHPIDMDWETSRWMDVTEDSVLTVNSNILIADLLAAAKNAPEVTADNHPVWTGLIFGYEYSGTLNNEVSRFQRTADWGFNSIRLKVDYEVFFSPDATQADVTMLCLLDQYVAAAIQNNLHLNLCFTTLPGRTVILHSDYTSEADLDLFINPEKQEMALQLWQILAERYQDVPSAYLSFTPFWEAGGNLSTGLPMPEYTFADIGAFAAKACDVIHKADENRLVICEVDGVSNGVPDEEATDNWSEFLNAVGERSNVMYDFDYVAGDFVYANMTATEGQHIDNNNHSFSLIDYPTVWPSLSPYIIDKSAGMEDALGAWPIEWDAEREKNLTLEGLLPAGTTLDIYLYGTLGGSIVIKADDEVIYEEALDNDGYERSELISGHIQFSSTDKKVSVTLERDTDLIEISSVGGAFFWSGMELTLPEEYAQEDWYFTSDYDVFLGLAEEVGLERRTTSTVLLWPYEEFDRGRHVVIHDDLSYTTDAVHRQANAGTISAALKAIAEVVPDAIIRYEDATFAAVKADGMIRYYEDILSAFAENDLSWWSNEWYGVLGYPWIYIAGAEYVPYDGETGQIYIGLLQLLQQYQNTNRP